MGLGPSSLSRDFESEMLKRPHPMKTSLQAVSCALFVLSVVPGKIVDVHLHAAPQLVFDWLKGSHVL